MLLAQDPQAFDPAVLWALVQTVGLFPAGTLLQTESGHTVLSLNNDREDLRRPHCRVVAYPDGSHALDGRPEIWEPMPRHEAVARVVPPRSSKPRSTACSRRRVGALPRRCGPARPAF